MTYKEATETVKAKLKNELVEENQLKLALQEYPEIWAKVKVALQLAPPAWAKEGLRYMTQVSQEYQKSLAKPCLYCGHSMSDDLLKLNEKYHRIGQECKEKDCTCGHWVLAGDGGTQEFGQVQGQEVA